MVNASSTTQEYEWVREAREKKSKLEDFMERSTHPAGDVYDEADKKIQEQVYDFYVTQGKLPNGIINSEDLKGDELKTGRDMLLGSYQGDIANILYNSPDKVVQGIPDSELEKLARQKTLLIKSKDDDSKVLRKYHAIKELEEFRDRYNDNKSVKEDLEDLEKYTQKGAKRHSEKMRDEAIEEERKRQEGKGYQDKRHQKNIGYLAEIGVKIAFSNKEFVEKQKRELILEGIKEDIEKADKEYKEVVKALGYDVHTAVKNTIVRLAKEKNKDEFTIAYAALEDPEGLDNKYMRKAA